MDEAAGMAVGALVHELIWRLQIEIRHHVLEQEHGDRGEDDDGDVGHGRYFDIASAVPSQLRRGRVVPEICDALAIERVETVEADVYQLRIRGKASAPFQSLAR